MRSSVSSDSTKTSRQRGSVLPPNSCSTGSRIAAAKRPWDRHAPHVGRRDPGLGSNVDTDSAAAAVGRPVEPCGSVDGIVGGLDELGQHIAVAVLRRTPTAQAATSQFVK